MTRTTGIQFDTSPSDIDYAYYMNQGRQERSLYLAQIFMALVRATYRILRALRARAAARVHGPARPTLAGHS